MVELLLLIPFLAGVFFLGETPDDPPEAGSDPESAPHPGSEAALPAAAPTVFFGRDAADGADFATDAFGLLDADAPEGALHGFDAARDMLRLEYTGNAAVSVLQSWPEDGALVLLLSTGAILRLPGLSDLPPERIRIVQVPV